MFVVWNWPQFLDNAKGPIYAFFFLFLCSSSFFIHFLLIRCFVCVSRSLYAFGFFLKIKETPSWLSMKLFLQNTLLFSFEWWEVGFFLLSLISDAWICSSFFFPKKESSLRTRCFFAIVLSMNKELEARKWGHEYCT